MTDGDKDTCSGTSSVDVPSALDCCTVASIRETNNSSTHTHNILTLYPHSIAIDCCNEYYIKKTYNLLFPTLDDE